MILPPHTCLDLLANRHAFATEWIGPNTNYRVRKDTDTTARLREQLRLHVTSTDYFVTIYAQLLRSHPDLVSDMLVVHDNAMPDQVMLHEAAPIISDGAALVPAADQPARIVRHAAEWPVQRELLLKQIHGIPVLVLGGMAEFIQVVRLGNILRVEWPAWSGVSGHIRLDDPEGTDEVRLHHWPVEFPFGLLRNLLAEYDAAQELLSAYGASLEFAYAEPSRGVALVLACLARETLKLPEA